MSPLLDNRLQQGPTYASLVLRALQRHPERIAFQENDITVSYQAVTDTLGKMQSIFSVLGLKQGEVVALLSANRWETWCAGVAALMLGAAVTSLHPLASQESQAFQLTDSTTKILVVDAIAFHERGGELAARFPEVNVLTLGEAQYGVDLLERLWQSASASPADFSLPEALGTLNYTGGTTGQPKGVMKSNQANAQSALSILADFALPARPRYLAVAPISHVSGTNVLPTLLKGGTVHLLNRYDPVELLSTIELQQINFTLLVPTMIYTLLDTPTLSSMNVSSLKLLLYGASPMSPSRLAEALDRIGPVFSQLYGQSECYPIAVLPREDHDIRRPELLAACGFPTSSCAVTLLDSSNNPVTQGEPGEICVRAAHAMTGYWGQAQLSREVQVNEWLHTGDIARADEKGRLYIVDRKKDMIISGGFNVYPREVEDALTTHPSVANAAVIGVPDPKWGEAVQAVIVLREGMAATPAELMQFVKDKKGPLLTPKSIRLVPNLPMTSLGKVDKKALRGVA